MKKISSIILAIVMLLSMNFTAFAAENTTEDEVSFYDVNQHQNIHDAKIAAEIGQRNITSTTIKLLSDFRGNYFELIEVGECGYMIFDPQSGKYLEEAIDSPSPYLGLSHNLYYFGPLNYYQLLNGRFVHTVISDEYDMSYTEVLALMQMNLNSTASNNRL